MPTFITQTVTDSYRHAYTFLYSFLVIDILIHTYIIYTHTLDGNQRISCYDCMQARAVHDG